MLCPYCQSECKKGYVYSKHVSHFTRMGIGTIWYPEEEEGKIIKNN